MVHAFDKRPNTPRFMEPPFNPRRQPDQLVMARVQELVAEHLIPFDLAFRLLQARNAPTQLRQTPRMVLDVNGFTPQILIQNNPQRMSFTVTNVSQLGNVFFAYGDPVNDTNGVFIGIELTPGQTFQEANGTVSTDDIFAWSDTANVTILGYEGVIAIEGKHN